MSFADTHSLETGVEEADPRSNLMLLDDDEDVFDPLEELDDDEDDEEDDLDEGFDYDFDDDMDDDDDFDAEPDAED